MGYTYDNYLGFRCSAGGLSVTSHMVPTRHNQVSKPQYVAESMCGNMTSFPGLDL